MNVIDPIASLLGEWSCQINVFSIIFRIAISLVMSAVIGCERSVKRHAAGLRTFMLVSLASSVAMMLDIFLSASWGVNFYFISASTVIASAIISANTMLYSSRNQIKGITTSVGLWAFGVLGLTAGAGYYTVTLVCFLSMLLSLAFFPSFETFLKNRSNHFEIHLELKDVKYLKEFVTTIRALGLKIDDIEANPAYHNSGLSVYSVALSIVSPELKKYKTHAEIIEAMRSLDYICHVEEMN